MSSSSLGSGCEGINQLDNSILQLPPYVFFTASSNVALLYTHRPMICCRLVKMRLPAPFYFPEKFACRVGAPGAYPVAK